MQGDNIDRNIGRAVYRSEDGIAGVITGRNGGNYVVTWKDGAETLTSVAAWEAADAQHIREMIAKQKKDFNLRIAARAERERLETERERAEAEASAAVIREARSNRSLSEADRKAILDRCAEPGPQMKAASREIVLRRLRGEPEDAPLSHAEAVSGLLHKMIRPSRPLTK